MMVRQRPWFSANGRRYQIKFILLQLNVLSDDRAAMP
jgi:hypothetical protein